MPNRPTAALPLALFALLPPCTVSAGEVGLFSNAVAPLLRQHCVACHNADKKRGGLDLTTREGLLTGGDSGLVVKPGAAADSRLLWLVAGPEAKMPKQGPKLTAEEVAVLRQWIDDGAPWPKDITIAEEEWWSLRPLTRLDRTRRQGRRLGAHPHRRLFARRNGAKWAASVHSGG